MHTKLIIPALIVTVLGTGCAQQDTTPTPVEATSTTPMPLEGPLLTLFEPAYACALQNDSISVSDGETCRSERITEVIVAEGDGVLFIRHTQHFGYGCWSGINAYQYALHVCDVESGERVTLTDHQTTPPVSSPDGEWLAYGDIDTHLLAVSVYKVRADGTVLQRLDTQGLPEATVGVNVLGWSTDGAWVDVSLWDGSADGWNPYRIQADGTGAVERVQK